MSELRETTQFDAEKPKSHSGLQVGSPVRVGRLSDLVTLRAELGRLYREARRRHGRYPDAITAQRLANVLGSIRNSIEFEMIDRRLTKVERHMKINSSIDFGGDEPSAFPSGGIG